MRTKRWIFPVVAFLALSSGVIAYNIAGLKQPKTYPTLHKFSLPDTKGTMRHTDEWNGKVLIINFWATWCPPCREEIPLFMQLQESHGDQGVQFVGIAIEEAEPVREYAENLRINYPMLIAGMPGLGLSIALGNLAQGVPFSVVVNRVGQIVYAQPGIFDREAFQETVVPLL